MKKHTRLFITLIVVITLLTLAGCTSGKEDNNTDNTDVADTQATPEVSPTEEPADTFEAVDGAIVVSVDPKKQFQTMDGFGAGFTYYANYAYYAPYKDEIYDLLFKDAHLSILRFKNGYRYDEEKEFDPKYDREYSEEATKRLAEIGIEPKVLMSSWSPAAYLKDSESLYGEGTIIKDKDGNYEYEKLGEYWAELIQAYRDQGVPVGYLCIQNEPDYTAAYESCTLNFEETETSASFPKAHLAVYNAVSQLDDPPKMLGPDSMSCNKGDISLYMGDLYKENPDAVYGIAHHLYVGGDENDPKSFMLNMQGINMAFPDIKKWMTEYYRGNFMTTAQIIQNALIYENLNAYIFWGGVWHYSIDAVADNMICVDASTEEEEFDHPHGYIIGEKYYSMRHFSEYILPGYIRVNTKIDSGEDRFNIDEISCSAFTSPDGKQMTMVAINDTDEPRNLQFDLEGYESSSSKVILTDYSKGTDTEEFYQDAGALDDKGCYEMPAHSIATIVLEL